MPEPSEPNADRGSTDNCTPISILACGGVLPLEIAEILRSNGRPVNVVCIDGMADADYDGFSLASVSIGRIGGLLAALRANGARDMVIAGHARRPDLRSLNIDFGFVRHILTVLSLTRGGDDHVLRRIAAFFERNGLTVRSIEEIAPALLTPAGVLTGNLTPKAEMATVAGLQLVRRLGPFDVGQAVIVENGRVVAIEGAEGTNGLLGRFSHVDGSRRQHVHRSLVKASKPEQDLRVDLPTIGPETIGRCVDAGINLIAVEAGRSLILTRDETLRLADDAGITVVGLVGGDTTQSEPATAGSGKLVCLARSTASPQAGRDAMKGLQLLSALGDTTRSGAALVSRDNVLAIGVDEALVDFVARSSRLAQWGDRRQKGKRNRTLAVSSPDQITPDLFEALDGSKVAGVALVDKGTEPQTLDRLVAEADRANLFVLSLE